MMFATQKTERFPSIDVITYESKAISETDPFFVLRRQGFLKSHPSKT